MLTAPDVKDASSFYVEHLGFRMTEINNDEAVVEGYGMHLVFTEGPRGRHTEAPDPREASIEIPSTMQRIEALWDRDRALDPTVLGPMLDPSGAFVYVTLDPAGNAVALLAALPSEREEPRERVTQRLKRPDIF
jgi:catechol 2,3-dioxygenase-like lactoylglutathione lyase family enzyme